MIDDRQRRYRGRQRRYDRGYYSPEEEEQLEGYNPHYNEPNERWLQDGWCKDRYGNYIDPFEQNRGRGRAGRYHYDRRPRIRYQPSAQDDLPTCM